MERDDIPHGAGAQYGFAQEQTNQCNSKLAESTLRDRLESKRNRLTQQLVQVEEALRLVYADPQIERNHETLKRAGF